MSARIRVLRQLFVTLCKIQKCAWYDLRLLEGRSDQMVNAFNAMLPAWPPVEEKEMEHLFSHPARVDIHLHRRALYLPPMNEEPDFLPLLTLECCLDDESDTMKLRVMFVHCGEDDERHCIGFRMEKGTSIHSYFHAQLIVNLEGVANPADSHLRCPCRIPLEQPAIPLKAEDAVTLVLCLLVSLYGVKYCWDLVTKYHVSELTRYLKGFGVPD